MSFFDLTILFQSLESDKNSEFLNNKINSIRKHEKYPPYI